MSLTDRIGVVVLTHNRRREILLTLARLTAALPGYRLCVVDNGSSDGSAEAIARDFPGVELLRLEHNLGAAGRNHGVARLAGDYVAFCDDDTWWEAGALERAAALLDEHPLLAAMTARVLVGADHREDPACRQMAASPLPAIPGLAGTAVAGILAGACVMRRRAFIAAGGYEPRLFIGGEERLLALDLMAAGWQLAYVPELVVHHHPSRLRDSAGRRLLLLRNALWCAWLRRPPASAWRETRRRLAESWRQPELAAALLAAVRGLPWVLRHRRVIPARVDSLLQLLEAAPGN